jgi:hypothetical protein
MGFLWWNCYPGQIFMGDVGSLALGGRLGTVAILIKQELLLPLVGGVFVLEASRSSCRSRPSSCAGSASSAWRPSTTTSSSSAGASPRSSSRFSSSAFVFALFAITTLKLDDRCMRTPWTWRGKARRGRDSARSGFAAAGFLASAGRAVVATDRKPDGELPPEALSLRGKGVTLELGAHREATFTGADAVVVSPGVPWDLRALATARARGVP